METGCCCVLAATSTDDTCMEWPAGPFDAWRVRLHLCSTYSTAGLGGSSSACAFSLFVRGVRGRSQGPGHALVGRHFEARTFIMDQV